jgi:NAD(P)-dependent dehydrogenase (short-subunit alcohol dehydrogenase family)
MAAGIPRERKAAFFDAFALALAAEQPAGRVARPEDIAAAAVLLASDLSRFVNGVALPVDGGADAVSLGRFSEIHARLRTKFGG